MKTKEKSITIRTKLILSFATVLLLMIAVAAVGVLRVSQIRSGLSIINDVNAVKQRYAINFRGSVHDRSIAIRDVVLAENQPQLRQEALAEIRELEQFYRESATPLNAIFDERDDIDDSERELLTAIDAIERQTLPVVEDVISLSNAGRFEAARTVLLDRARPLFVEWLATINAFIDFQEAANNQIADQTRALARGFAQLMMLTTGAAVLAGILLSVWMLRAIKPLHAIRGALSDIARGEGDLTRALDESRTDEVGQVAHEFNGFVSSLREIIAAVRDSVGTLSTASQGLSSNMEQTSQAVKSLNQNIEAVRVQITETQAPEVQDVSTTVAEIDESIRGLSHAIEQQADTIDNMSAALEEMIANVSSVTQTLEKSADQMSHLETVSAHGFELLEEVSRMVAEISEQSQGMEEANEVITNIAAQTNLLAMNAAIEAAHAGDAGRGFAVVAEEIRNLAENSSTQSTSISGVLKNLQESIHAVVARTTDAGHAFEDVRTAIDTVSHLNSTIKNAMDEQTVGNQQLLESFELITRLTGEVRQGGHTMSDGSARIREKMGNLVQTTQSIEENAAAMSTDTTDIGKSVQHVAELTHETQTEVQTVQQTVQRFRLD
ncbi:MAG TPA: methyl-accepting chemotaxis protein [Alkalispirochaeta sp.]|nr:methyl-accepting chemotaxis protein [Alkalispirochaeta sp.]